MKLLTLHLIEVFSELPFETKEWVSLSSVSLLDSDHRIEVASAPHSSYVWWKTGPWGKAIIYLHWGNKKEASFQISPHLLLAAFRVRRKKQTKDVKWYSSNSQALKENFIGLNMLSPGLTAILNWSNSRRSLTIELILYSVYALLIVSNYCTSFPGKRSCLPVLGTY